MSIRLTLAVEAQGFVVPEEGRVLVMQATAAHDLSALPRDRVLVVQPLKPDHDGWAAQGFAVAAEIPADERFAAAVVFATRAKAECRQRVAEAAAVTDGQLLLDGAKTEGIDSLLKELKKRTTPSAAISKAHGKAFWIEAGLDLADWLPGERAPVEGFVTAPGVFSADGVDPASRMLAAALPEKLGARVADLGAGWGYLSAAAFERAGVKSLDLVEANHVALICARQNVTDERASFHWADARDWGAKSSIDTVIMNPPFHSGRSAEPSLGQAFITNASRILVGSGRLYLVANRHLPYEATLDGAFAKVTEVAGDRSFKVLLAERPKRAR
ncbi:Ribosomal RNA large subunit methyltransferase G [Tritonibacter multivorans]|uniref:Ribosomal RNA large subunit methyltransferase G n=1 Tax=Tritonibacter multivorans TaxID=928856 RepID=A0A0P1G380_9RHOB|nr:class I SAM-dependent methyltransferase [Tritonibacter multivorans]MDA7419766.1 class I SAM-dependent methyltransferase [Tritonibacter multivorans]CUH76131.1 Ribosomal RNA large subunit methyltransferase G [Tritonibacter multivorans]SFC54765.1 16S rRNA (guanine1207-N2)-methyltransferase [Tritonibacter multivorans]